MNSWDQLLDLLPEKWRQCLSLTVPAVLQQVQELRVRQGRPILAYGSLGELVLTTSGLSPAWQEIVVAEPEHVRHLLATISQSSIYALEEELRSGYVTISGGHRVGLSGRAVTENGRVRTLKYICGFNIRIARQVLGCARSLLPYLFDQRGRLLSTLLVAPPQGGKTTMLRDVTRSLSYGEGCSRGYKIVVVDERSELASCYQGVPQLDIGPRADVLDACPKAEGMMMALRSLGPEVLVTDEIGRREDAEAIEEALHCGVTVIATAHGSSWDELLLRPALQELLSQGSFDRYVFLSTRQGPGTIELVLDKAKNPVSV
ncbi:MAG: stage III sporulation protein AA [Firmicutes bacterium]|nr:stage III sporulation protein AA [Bacillota bacterium]